jgi:hypothetical protein
MNYVMYSTSHALQLQTEVFFISNFRQVLNVVCFSVGNSPASEVYMPTFRNTVCSIIIGG